MAAKTIYLIYRLLIYAFLYRAAHCVHGMRSSSGLVGTCRASFLSSRSPRIRRHTRGLRSRPSNATPPPPEPPDKSNGVPVAKGVNTPSSAPIEPSIASTLAQLDDAQNNLLAPVHIPEDPHAVIRSRHPAAGVLSQSGLVVQRQIEMMNIFLGFEQANRYVILDPHGKHIGYMAEHDGGLGKAMGRQMFRTHRPFTTNVFDRHGQEVLRFNRPFSWINSKIGVYNPLEADYNSHKAPPSLSADLASTTANLDAQKHLSPLPLSAMRVIGEAHSEWAPLRRKYNLFLSHDPSLTKPFSHEPLPPNPTPNFTQFAYIDEPFLSWDFKLQGVNDALLGSVNRNFAGLGRELFTDMGTYVLRMDSAAVREQADPKTGQTVPAYAETVGRDQESMSMTLDQRAVMLATAVTVDFDYFSRHSHAGGGMMMPFYMGGSAGEAGAAGAGAAGGAGAAEAGTGAVVGGAGRAVGGAAGAAGAGGVGEGAMAGAGSLAGYEAMQRATGRGDYAEQTPPAGAPPGDPQSPQTPTNEYGDPADSFPQDPAQGEGGGDAWGQGDNDPWSGGADAGGGGGGGGGGEGGGGFLSSLWDSFFND